MIPVSVTSLSLSNMGFVVLLRSKTDERSLPIFIGMPEAQSLALALNHTAVPRPMTHDLMKNVLDMLECRLESVHVVDLREGTFFGVLNVATEGRLIAIDARPSDAIALALRCNAPVFVEEKVMDEAGVVMKEESKEKEPSAATVALAADKAHSAPAAPPPPPNNPAARLRALLEAAIRDERYEEAAHLRDQIRKAEMSS